MLKYFNENNFISILGVRFDCKLNFECVCRTCAWYCLRTYDVNENLYLEPGDKYICRHLCGDSVLVLLLLNKQS